MRNHLTIHHEGSTYTIPEAWFVGRMRTYRDYEYTDAVLEVIKDWIEQSRLDDLIQLDITPGL